MRRFYTYLLNRTPLARNTSVTNVLSQSASVVTYGSLSLCAISSFGVDITPLVTSLGVTSAIGAFASRDILSNIISGIYMTVNVPFNDKDMVRVMNGSTPYEGRIINWDTKCLWLKQSDGSKILIPNNVLTSSVIVLLEDELVVKSNTELVDQAK